MRYCKLAPEDFRIQTPKFQMSLNSANSSLNIELPQTKRNKQNIIIKSEIKTDTIKLF